MCATFMLGYRYYSIGRNLKIMLMGEPTICLGTGII
ncbi:hypothetical protein J007_06098 [Cryptococcus neoformans]|nr:hypothetical protein J007_06098 [Cryptococcus neoformans var. grubii]